MQKLTFSFSVELKRWVATLNLYFHKNDYFISENIKICNARKKIKTWRRLESCLLFAIQVLPKAQVEFNLEFEGGIVSYQKK